METFSLEEFVVVPWSSDSEWQLVRQYIYASKDLQNYKQALRKLLLWKTRGRPLNRGLYCTELILQVISKDSYFCDVDAVVEENDLIRLYSMAIMKFVNLTADITGKGPQKSMYLRASRLELPSWLIDMRHKISHDQDLPSLESLRKAMEFLLKWLQTKYWNEDNNFLVIEPKLTTSMVDVFAKMVDFYLLNQKRSIDQVLKNELSNYLMQKLDVSEFSYKINMLMMKKTLQNKDWSPQFISVFVTRYLILAQECNEDKISKADLDTWRVLLYYLIDLGFLTNLLQCLVTQNSHKAALWVVELCSLAFEIKKNVFCKPKQINGINLPRKLISFDSNLVLRTALNSVHSYTSIFLEWLLQIQSNPLTAKQNCELVKLVSLYTNPVKTVNSENKIFSVNDLIEKTNDQSQWSLAFGQENWKDIPIGSAM